MRKYSEVVVAPVPNVVSSRSMPAIAVVAADGDQRSKYPKPKSPRCSADAGAAACCRRRRYRKNNDSVAGFSAIVVVAADVGNQNKKTNAEAVVASMPAL